jgi:hypothetical protein
LKKLLTLWNARPPYPDILGFLLMEFCNWIFENLVNIWLPVMLELTPPPLPPLPPEPCPDISPMPP